MCCGLIVNATEAGHADCSRAAGRYGVSASKANNVDTDGVLISGYCVCALPSATTNYNIAAATIDSRLI